MKISVKGDLIIDESDFRSGACPICGVNIRKFVSGVDQIAAALGFAPGSVDFDAMVDKIRRLRDLATGNVELIRGELDIVITPLVSSSLEERGPGGGLTPKLSHLEFTVKGFPGFRATLPIRTCQELRTALDTLLAPKTSQVDRAGEP